MHGLENFELYGTTWEPYFLSVAVLRFFSKFVLFSTIFAKEMRFM